MTQRPWNLLIQASAQCRRAVIVAPYVKANILSLLLDVAQNLESLTCVTRWKPADVSLGVSDVEVRDLVLAARGKFLLHPTLHAKYYRFDDVVLVGSANMTSPGVGLSRSSNVEILCTPENGFDHREFESGLLDRSRPISDVEYDYWSSIPVVGGHKDLDYDAYVDEWRPITRDPQDVWLVYSGGLYGHVSDTVLEHANSDIAAIGAADGLNHHEYSRWVYRRLMSSAFVQEVIGIPLAAEPVAYVALADAWEMTAGVARYEAETVHNWLSYFGEQK